MDDDALEDWRAPTDEEAAIFARMLAANLTGVENLRIQSQNMLVRGIPSGLSLFVKVTKGEPAIVKTNVPVEARYPDSLPPSSTPQESTVPHTNLLLFVTDGYMEQLFVYKGDGNLALRPPAPGELKIFTPYHWENE